MKIGGKMKRVQCLLFMICFLILSGLFYGCGGSGPGSPGSHGTEDTGVILEATIIPEYLGANTNDVDAFRISNCDGDPTTNDPEPYTQHDATVTINASLINPNSTFQAGDLFIEKYTVEYRRSTDSIGTPPIEKFTEFKSIIIPAPSGTGINTVTDTLFFVDLPRKTKYVDDMTSGSYSSSMNNPFFLNNYTAIYTFEGKNEFGTNFSFKTQVGFVIGYFDNCGG